MFGRLLFTVQQPMHDAHRAEIYSLGQPEGMDRLGSLEDDPPTIRRAEDQDIFVSARFVRRYPR